MHEEGGVGAADKAALGAGVAARPRKVVRLQMALPVAPVPQQLSAQIAGELALNCAREMNLGQCFQRF